MTFIFPANGKNSTSAVRCLAFVRRNEYVCACRQCVIFAEGSVLEFDIRRDKMKGKLAFAV